MPTRPARIRSRRDQPRARRGPGVRGSGRRTAHDAGSAEPRMSQVLTLPPASGAWREGDDPGRRQWVALPAPLAAGGRRRAARGADRLRDLGFAERRRYERGADPARAHRATATSPARPGPATRRRAGGRPWSGPAGRWTRSTGSWWRPTWSAAARAAPGRPRSRRTAGSGAAGSRWSPSGTRWPPRWCWPTRWGWPAGPACWAARWAACGPWSGRCCSPSGWRGCSCWPARPRRRPTRSAGRPRNWPRSGPTRAGAAGTTTARRPGRARTSGWASPGGWRI